MKKRLFLFICLLITAALTLRSCYQSETEVMVTDVILDQYDAVLDVGDVLELKATVVPDDATNKTITWSSSVPSVASVDDKGKITALAVGKAVIAAKAGSIIAPCTVIVNPAKIDIAELKLNKDSLNMIEGDEETLEVTIVPEDATEQTVHWSSSNTYVATVDNGKVVAVREGTAVITAYADGKSVSCQVTVEKAPEPLPEAVGIYISGQDAYVYDPRQQQISIYSAEGNSWYRFLFPATMMMYQVGPIPDNVAVGDSVSVVMETYTSGVETAQAVNYSLEIMSMDGVKMTLMSAQGDLFILRY